MTYCVAIAVNDGLVFCSDSRTNAGPDMISTYSKMHVFRPAADRYFVVLTSGNLATTQAIIAQLESQEQGDDGNCLLSCKKMIDAARYVSQISRTEQAQAAETMTDATVDTSASLIFGGQINGAPPAIYMIYAAGNFITDSDENPFLQIGESKYGKPILDRILTRQTSLEDAARCAIVSMDSTIRSNATVGPPIEVLVCHVDTLNDNHYARLEEDDPYLRSVKQAWNEALKLSFSELPRFEWEKRSTTPSLHAVKNEHTP